MTAECLNKLQTLFSEKQAYVQEERLSGTVVIFPETFIRLLREGFTTGCLAKMSEDELLLTKDLIRYLDGDTTNMNTAVIEALDAWLVNIVNCEDNPIINSCFNLPEHTYNDCGL